MPKKGSDNDRLLAAARGMADAAEKQKEAFTSHGLADDFVEQLRKSASALDEALNDRVETGRPG